MRQGSFRFLRRLALGGAFAAIVATAACELEEVTVVEVEDAVVAEVYVQLGGPGSGGPRVIAWLHRTLQESGNARVPGASVVVDRVGGGSIELGPASDDVCISLASREDAGSCYWAPSISSVSIQPGDRLELTITLADGGTLRSASSVPGAFEIRGIADGATCLLPPDTPLPLTWSSSPDTWAYFSETTIVGLRSALAPRGIEVESDTLALLGLSISAADTSIVFPAEFGVFDRFDLDQEVAAALQAGLPAGSAAPITIAATDRNFVNWVRGGTFNPSGQVRVPSIQGDGTGVFASMVIRGFQVVAGTNSPPGQALAACPIS